MHYNSGGSAGAPVRITTWQRTLPCGAGVPRENGGTRFPHTPVFIGRCAAWGHGRL